jgi:hypothetical protein
MINFVAECRCQLIAGTAGHSAMRAGKPTTVFSGGKRQNHIPLLNTIGPQNFQGIGI